MTIKKEKKFNIVISGAYGRTNSGDEAILFSIINQIKRINPNINMTVLSLNPKKTCINYNVNSIYTFNIFKIKKILKECDLFISGGGTLLQNITSTRSLLYYLYVIKQANKYNCKVIMYGCGIGPIYGALVRKITTKILNKCVDNILIRDTSSLTELKKLNVDIDKVILGIDPSLLLNDYVKIDEKILSKLSLNSNKKYLGICIKKYDNKFIYEIVKVIKYLYTKGYVPVFIPMNYKEDLAILKEVANKIENNYYIIDDNISFPQKFSLISKMDLVIGMRLHSILFAYLSNVKVIGISYDKKIDSFCNDYEIYNLISINEFNFNSFIKQFNNLNINNFNVKKIRNINKNNIDLLKQSIKEDN